MGTVSTTRRCPSLSAFFSMNFQNVSPGVWLCNKPVSRTPLEAVLELKKLKPALRLKPVTYAGRLDPMAEGLLILLSGKKVHEKEKFLKLDKTYVATAIFGISTDSLDILGLPKFSKNTRLLPEQIHQSLKALTGKLALPLPIYSSPTYQGQPLHSWARKGEKVTPPNRTTSVYSVNIIRFKKIDTKTILKYTQKHIPQVKGDFRQTKILNAWQNLLSTPQTLQAVQFTVHCQSGTYIRSLVHHLGQMLQCDALLYSLQRTKIGPFDLHFTKKGIL